MQQSEFSFSALVILYFKNSIAVSPSIKANPSRVGY